MVKLWKLFKITLAGMLILFSVFAFNQFRLSSSFNFPIHTVRVYGLQHVTKSEAEETLTPLVKRGFFAINVEAIRDRLLQLPWIEDIFVRRIWPDQVEITLVEKKPIARWTEYNMDKFRNSCLLAEDGEFFSPPLATYPANLVKFVGPAGKQGIMLQFFNDINRILLPLHAKISSLELTPYLAWKVKLDNGISLELGHKDVLTRLSHFVKVYPKIVGNRVGDVDYIDLRYPNGVAVRWKSTNS